MSRSEGRSGKGAGKKDEKGKKDSPRDVDLLKMSNAGTCGFGNRSTAATVAPAPAAASSPKPSAVSGPSLKPRLTTATNGIGSGTDESVLPASGKAATANIMNLKKTVSKVIASSQFVSPATGLVVARVRHAAPGHVISVQERGQLARWSF